MKNIKLILWAVLAFMLLGVGVARAEVNPAIYQKDLTADEVIKKIQNSEFLPLQLNHTSSFYDQAEKDRVLKVVKEQVKKHNNYQAHYNAAVVYATYPEFFGFDCWNTLNEHDAANAIRHAGLAIGFSPKTPYMYLLRGQVYFDQGVTYSAGAMEYYIISHDAAKKSLADFEKVMDLHPGLAPYHDMAAIARLLHKTDKAQRYESLARVQEEALVKKQKEASSKKVKDSFLKRLAKHMASQRPQRAN